MTQSFHSQESIKQLCTQLPNARRRRRKVIVMPKAPHYSEARQLAERNFILEMQSDLVNIENDGLKWKLEYARTINMKLKRDRFVQMLRQKELTLNLTYENRRRAYTV